MSALEDAWEHLQGQYPEIPDTVIVLGSGTEKGTLTHWGHWAPQSWTVGEALTGEFKLCGEAISFGADAVYGILVHEAAHALNEVRGIKDTSRQGRYHNAKYASTAEELGLSVDKNDDSGYSQTVYTPRSEDRAIVRAIEEALKIEKPVEETVEEEEEERAPTSVKTECACPRNLRIKITTYDEGPILCGICEETFTECL